MSFICIGLDASSASRGLTGASLCPWRDVQKALFVSSDSFCKWLKARVSTSLFPDELVNLNTKHTFELIIL